MDIGKWKIFSTILMIIGWLAALGASIVANFQEGAQLAIHNTGAFTLFFGIVIYFWGQLIIAYALKPKMVSTHLTNFRLILNILCTVILVFHVTCLFAKPFVKSTNGTKPVDAVPNNGIVRHMKGDPFYYNWIASTISEWTLAILLNLHLLTYVHDLNAVSVAIANSSKCGSLVKTVNDDMSVDQVYAECPTTIFNLTSSRRQLHRIDQLHESSSSLKLILSSDDFEIVSFKHFKLQMAIMFHLEHNHLQPSTLDLTTINISTFDRVRLFSVHVICGNRLQKECYRSDDLGYSDDRSFS
ncbi:hypothetical protein DICVIV_13275 [Dictyocaulus viviparus]|uniref:CWH43-like N-terminal domain-containing protein n=1 Tax=Dictyocaulus viviparus TaxID=29172 RepID=A0A0D8XAV2_DICVI|nr:hypothetical protein DICVIV_13275 [Dictyocaulus viviparus]